LKSENLFIFQIPVYLYIVYVISQVIMNNVLSNNVLSQVIINNVLSQVIINNELVVQTISTLTHACILSQIYTRFIFENNCCAQYTYKLVQVRSFLI